MSSDSFVTLVSADGQELIVREDVAKHSAFLKDAFDRDWSEAESKRVTLGEYPGYIVEKICEYLVYRDKHTNNTGGQIPDFIQQIPKEMALELLMAADFLSC